MVRSLNVYKSTKKVNARVNLYRKSCACVKNIVFVADATSVLTLILPRQIPLWYSRSCVCVKKNACATKLFASPSKLNYRYCVKLKSCLLLRSMINENENTKR